jgi:hypothetical protein
VLAWQRKVAGLDWKKFVLSQCVTGKLMEVPRLKGDPSYATEEQRAQAFVSAGLGCRVTYFNIAKKLRPSEPVPAMIVKGKPPALTVTVPAGVIHVLRDRFGKLGEG